MHHMMGGRIYEEIDGERVPIGSTYGMPPKEFQAKLSGWYQSVFRCNRCGCVHGYVAADPANPQYGKDYPSVRVIEKDHRYLDCTAWNCPGCGYLHDSRYIQGCGFLGGGGNHTYDPVVPLSPHRVIERVRGEGNSVSYRLDRHGGW